MSTSPQHPLDPTTRVVVITGAGSGIGRSLAVQSAGPGRRLGLCDRDPAGLAETAQLARAKGATVVESVVDVSDSDQVTSFAKEVRAELGLPDLLINNAGIGVIGGILDTTLPDWERLVGVNLMGVVHGVAAFGPEMAERGSGHIVNISSLAGVLASPGLGAYSTTKFAVFGLSEALGMELRPHGITVTAVCPGVVNTPITQTSQFRGGNCDARQAKMSALYAKRGYTADKAAANILKAVGRKRAVAPITPEAHVLYRLSRLTPGFARRISALMAKAAE